MYFTPQEFNREAATTLTKVAKELEEGKFQAFEIYHPAEMEDAIYGTTFEVRVKFYKNQPRVFEADF